MATSDVSITETITGTGAGANILQLRHARETLPRYVQIWGTGTYAGTIQIKAGPPNAGVYGVAQTFVITGSDGFSTVLQCAANEDIITNCSAYTSGTLTVNLRVT